jgi:di/tricarboxylate transporter
MATENTDRQEPETRRFHAGRVTGGVILLGVGILMLLDRTRVIAGHASQLIPGFVLILIGAVQMIEPRECGRRGGPFRGLWPILIGVWLLVNAVELWGLTYRTSWPLLIVAMGVLMVAREMLPRGRRSGGQER